MTKPSERNPITVEFRTPRPLPVTDLATLTTLTQEIADRIGAGTLYLGQHFRQDDTAFLVTFAGHIPPADDEDQDDEPGLPVNTCPSTDQHSFHVWPDTDCSALCPGHPAPPRPTASRPTASTITDAQLDALYAERDRLAADLAAETELRQERTHLYGLWRDKTNELAPQLAAAEASIARVRELAERWWQHQDRRRPRAELLAALNGPKLAADS
jgi:hypothetical protein